MSNRNKKIISYLFLLSLVFAFNSSFAKPEDKNEPENLNKQKETEKNNFKSVLWTETLSLQDFFLLPEYVELKDKIKEYKIALAKTYTENPLVFSTAISYGLLLIDLGELEKARVVWEKAVKDFHSNEAPKAYKAWLDARLGNYQAAKDVWYPIAKEKVDKGVAGFNVGIWLPYHIDSVVGLYLIKNHLPEEQREEVSKVVYSIAGVFPGNQKFAAILVNEYLSTGQFEKAAGILVGALKNYPDEPTLITLLGIAQLMKNHYDEALKLFDRAEEINPNVLTTHIMRARALFALKREKESFEELDKATALNPDLIIPENKKKKYLSAKSYIVLKKIKKEDTAVNNQKPAEKTDKEKSPNS